mgnify:CR=1 FL=1|jgi:hypothetical protein
MTEKTLNRYLKVKALAERGAHGEKEAAQRTLGKMEKRYPGIKEEAEELARSRASAHPSTSPAAPHSGSRQGWNPFLGKAGNWENIFRQAAGFYSTVMDVVEEVADAYYGRVLAENEVEVSGSRRKGDLFIRVKIPLKTAKEAQSLNGAQKAAFREAVQEGVETYLDAVLGE